MPVKRIIESNVIIYSLIKTHPAYRDCTAYLQKYDDIDVYSSVSDTLYEIFHTLTVFYGIDASIVYEQIQNLMESNIIFKNLTIEEISRSFELSIINKIDITDSRLFLLAQKINAPIIVTDDRFFGNFIRNNGLLWETPISNETRKKIEVWEATHVPPKGLPRILNKIYKYLISKDQKIAEIFRKDSNDFINIPPS